MDPFKFIYTHQAHAYHQMIAAEDADSNLLPALERVADLDGKRVLDLGSGTGRLPLLLHQKAGHIVGLDSSLPMLKEQRLHREAAHGNWDLLLGDMRALPIPDGWADVAIAGWSIGHFRSWYEADWRLHIRKVLQEMHRTVHPSGALIILETLTTGSLLPKHPTPGLADYYAWLEDHWGFNRQEIRTDYQFFSVQEAVEQTEFFFGTGLANKIRTNSWSRIPEWTGLWVKIK